MLSKMQLKRNQYLFGSVLKPILTSRMATTCQPKQSPSLVRKSETVHRLTKWDSEKFLRQQNPCLGWVVKGDVKVDRLSSTLKQAVATMAPWLSGRLYIREDGEARYGIRTPQEESETSPFDVTIFEDPGRELYEILPAYIPAGLSMPCVRRYSPRSIECIRPLSQFSIDADEAALTNQKLMHLHIVRAKDLTAICIAWRHVVMDATAMGHVIAHWELLLGRIETHLPSDAEQGPEIKRMTKAKHDSMADFIDTRSGSTTTELAGWSPLSWWQIPLIIGQAILDRQFYPVTFGAAYIPKTLLEKWVSSARIELGEGVRVSRNDIIAAWFYKTTCSIYASGTIATLSRAVNMRGKHDALPANATGNVVALAVSPSMSVSSLADHSIAQIALMSRKAVIEFSDINHIVKWRDFFAQQSSQITVPGTSVLGRRCLVTSHVNIGVSQPNFGKGIELQTAVQLTVDSSVVRVIDDVRGGWRISGKLPKFAWDAVEAALVEESRNLQA